jgi:hypothetical protein
MCIEKEPTNAAGRFFSDIPRPMLGQVLRLPFGRNESGNASRLFTDGTVR